MDVLIADVPRSSDRDAPFMGDKSRASSSAMLAKDDDTQFSKHKFPPAFGYPKSSSHFSKIAGPGITGKADDKVPSTSGALPHHKRMDKTVEEGIQQVLESIKSGQVVDYQEAKYNNAKFLSEAGAYQLDKDSRWAEEILQQLSPGDPVSH